MLPSPLSLAESQFPFTRVELLQLYSVDFVLFTHHGDCVTIKQEQNDNN